ncbi:cation-translocating P-type ATPase, partial [Candidatus Roizmanbacteria bacterium]|nr:cation-translocating P-type ATPase [Candidatus Roizmanbacteria bacterium]
PGDVIFIEEGLKIPADSEIHEGRNLEFNEASLTGESLPVEKKNGDKIYMGTIVTKGRGFARVQATGMNTQFGKIATHISLIEEGKTPLQRKLESLTKTIGIVGIILSLVVFLLSLAQGSTYFPSFLLAISLAVAVVPEGLPAVMTITLAIGVKEMAKKRAIIRKLSAIEALGSVTLIATDKTGTLTTNQMKVKEIFVDNKLYTEEKPPSLTNHPFSKMLLDGILCSSASLVINRGQQDLLGDPTEGALLYLSHRLGLMPEMVRKEWDIIDEEPFDSITKRMSVLVVRKGLSIGRFSQRYVFSKGAPESILEISDKILIGQEEKPLTSAKVKEIESTMELWAKKGLRVLAFAYTHGKKAEKLDAKNLVFLGIVAIHDPPRPEVLEAIKKTHDAGIKVVMITGDNELTAKAIGISVGLIKDRDEIITGSEIDKFTDELLFEKLSTVKVFARTTPFHKARIVRLYQQQGDVVAVTGDGVNDAVALKQADVGVAMGLIGTDVARETADMVITDDNFATIVNAIEEGRNIVKNLKNAIKYLLSCNVTEAFSLIVGLLLGIPNLFYAIQLLYINLITDGIPALALAFSPREENSMRRPPAKELELLSLFGKKYIFSVGILATIIVLASYFIFADGEVFRRTAAFSVLALIQSFIFIDLWLSHHPLHRHFKKLFSAVFFVAFSVPFITQYFILKIPSLAQSFKIETVSTTTYFSFVFIAFFILVGIKGVKKMITR